MMPFARIFRDYDESGALNSLVNLYGFTDDHVFLTKSGDLGVVLALDGVDYECLDPDQREAVTRRFEVALRVLDESMRLSQYVLKRNRVGVPHTPSTDPVVDRLLARRQQWLEDKRADLYTLRLYAVLLAESDAHAQAWASRLRAFLAAPLTTLRDRLSTRRTILLLDDEIERLRRRLLHKVDTFVVQLQDTVRPRVLAKEEAFRFFRQLLNYDPVKADAIRLRRDTFLDYDAGDSALECHRDHLRLGDQYVRVLTLKEPPAQTFPHLFQALYEIPSNLILMNDWRREGQGAMRKVIHAKRRHFHNARVSLTSYLGDTPATSNDLLVDDSAAAVVKDLGACLTEMTLHGRYAGEYTMTVVLYDTDQAALDRSVAACTKAFAAHDAQVTDERMNLLNAWLAVLPGNSAYNLRSMYLLNTNYADLACLFAQDAGSATNPHLGRESLAVLETTQATLYHVNLHVDDVAHALILGATGSGKSFFLNFLIAHLQRYAPRTMIFDLGGSYDALTRHFGGTALRLGFDRRDVTINPFCLPPTPANLHFLSGFVKVLIQSGGQYTMTVADDRDLYEQIEAFYGVDPDQRRLFTLANILRRPLAQALQRWVQGGPYAALFDQVEDTLDNLTGAPFQYVDFEGLDAYPQLLEPLLFYLLHRADAAMTDPGLAATLKVFVLDEAWRFLRDPTIRQYVTEALKTWRKKNACVLLATQSSEDLARSELLRVAIESCPTKVFLANPQIDRAVYQELFHLNETEAERIATLVSRQQLLLKRPDVAKVLNLTVDPDSARLFSLASSRA
jgi:type IV secretion system protein VirB4